MEYAGIVEVRPGSGAYVSEPRQGPGAMALGAMESPEKLIEARVAVEPAIARLCATSLTPERAAGLAALVDKAAREGHRVRVRQIKYGRAEATRAPARKRCGAIQTGPAVASSTVA